MADEEEATPEFYIDTGRDRVLDSLPFIVECPEHKSPRTSKLRTDRRKDKWEISIPEALRKEHSTYYHWMILRKETQWLERFEQAKRKQKVLRLLDDDGKDYIIRVLILQNQICQMMKKGDDFDCKNCICVKKGWAELYCGARLDELNDNYTGIIY